MMLFSKDIDKKLFNQYKYGSDLKNQKVICKIFNPYQNGRWFIINSDEKDPDYLWAIVQMGDTVEVGSVSRQDLISARVGRFRFPLERDLGFSPVNAAELLRGLNQGKFYADGGYMAKGGMVVTSIKDIPNFKQRLDEGKITYRGLGLGKLWDDFNKLTGTTGTRIKVDGKEYFITDEEFNTFSRGADGKLRIRFDAPFRKSYEDGGYMAKGGKIKGITVSIQGESEDIKDIKSNLENMSLYQEENVSDYDTQLYFYNLNQKDAEYIKRMVNDNYENVEVSINHLADGGMMAKGGELMKHKHLDYLTIELIEPTSKGWKVKQIETHSIKGKKLSAPKEKIAYFSKDEIKDLFEPTMAKGGGVEDKFKGKNSKEVWNNLDFSTRAKVLEYLFLKEKSGDKQYYDSYNSLNELSHSEWDKLPKNIKKEIENFDNGGSMAKGGIYASDNLYILKVSKEGKEVGEERFRAKNVKEAKEMGEDYEEKYKTKFGGDLSFSVKEAMSMGGKVTFDDKVSSIKKSLLKKKTVSPKVQKDYGKTYNKKEALESAKRIAGAMKAKYRK